MKTLLPYLFLILIPFSGLGQKQYNKEERVQDLNEKAIEFLAPKSDKVSNSIDSAIYYLEFALSIDSSKKIIYHNLSGAYMRKGEYSKVTDLFDRFLNIYPENIGGKYQQSLAYYCLGKEKKAKDNLMVCDNLYKEKIEKLNRKEDIVNRAFVLILLDNREGAYKLLNGKVKDYPELTAVKSSLENFTISHLLPCNDK